MKRHGQILRECDSKYLSGRPSFTVSTWGARGGGAAPLSRLARGRATAAGAAGGRDATTAERGGPTPVDPYSSHGSRFRQSTAGIGFYRHAAINTDGLTAADRRQWLTSESKRLNAQRAIERTDKPNWDRSIEVKHPRSPRLGDSPQPLKLPALASWKQPGKSTPWKVSARRRKTGKSTKQNDPKASPDTRHGARAAKPRDGKFKLPQVPGVAAHDGHRRPRLKKMEIARSIYVTGGSTVRGMDISSYGLQLQQRYPPAAPEICGLRRLSCVDE